MSAYGPCTFQEIRGTFWCVFWDMSISFKRIEITWFSDADLDAIYCISWVASDMDANPKYAPNKFNGTGLTYSHLLFTWISLGVLSDATPYPIPLMLEVLTRCINMMRSYQCPGKELCGFHVISEASPKCLVHNKASQTPPSIYPPPCVKCCISHLLLLLTFLEPGKKEWNEVKQEAVG